MSVRGPLRPQYFVSRSRSSFLARIKRDLAAGIESPNRAAT